MEREAVISGRAKLELYFGKHRSISANLHLPQSETIHRHHLATLQSRTPLVQHSDADTVIGPAQSIQYFGRLVVECPPLPEMGLIA